MQHMPESDPDPQSQRDHSYQQQQIPGNEEREDDIAEGTILMKKRSGELGVKGMYGARKNYRRAYGGPKRLVTEC